MAQLAMNACHAKPELFFFFNRYHKTKLFKRKKPQESRPIWIIIDRFVSLKADSDVSSAP